MECMRMFVKLLNGDLIEIQKREGDKNENDLKEEVRRLMPDVPPLDYDVFLEKIDEEDDLYMATVAPTRCIDVRNMDIANLAERGTNEWRCDASSCLFDCSNESILRFFMPHRKRFPVWYTNPHPLVVCTVDYKLNCYVVRNPHDEIVTWILSHDVRILTPFVREMCHNTNPRVHSFLKEHMRFDGFDAEWKILFETSTDPILLRFIWDHFVDHLDALPVNDCDTAVQLRLEAVATGSLVPSGNEFRRSHRPELLHLFMEHSGYFREDVDTYDTDDVYDTIDKLTDMVNTIGANSQDLAVDWILKQPSTSLRLNDFLLCQNPNIKMVNYYVNHPQHIIWKEFVKNHNPDAVRFSLDKYEIWKDLVVDQYLLNENPSLCLGMLRMNRNIPLRHMLYMLHCTDIEINGLEDQFIFNHFM